MTESCRLQPPKSDRRNYCLQGLTRHDRRTSRSCERLVSSRKRPAESCSTCSVSWIHSPLARLLCTLVLFITVQPSIQVIEFLQEPAPYYYFLPNSVATIPCHVVETLSPDETRRTLSPIFFRGSTPITRLSSPPRHELQVDGQQRVLALIIVGVTSEDNNVVVHCSVERNGEVVLRSRNSTILVGDGRPFAPPEPPYQASETVQAVALEWEVPITPPSAPILNYTISYWLLNQSRDDAVSIETSSNDTAFYLDTLLPGHTYNVVVRGRNVAGLGAESAPLQVLTMLGEVPPPPESVAVRAEREVRGEGAVLIITWQAPMLDPDLMTPVTNYHIFLNQSRAASGSEGAELGATVVGGNITTLRLNISEDGTYRVGVAASNAAGQGEITYHEGIDVVIAQLPEVTTASSAPVTTETTPMTPGISTTSGTPETVTPDTPSEIPETPSVTPETQETQTSSTTSGSTKTPGIITDTEESISRSAIVTIIAVVVAASLLLVILSILIFLVIFYLRVKMKHMENYDIPDGGESPRAKQMSYFDKKAEDDKDDVPKTFALGGASNINNSNNLSGYSTLPLRTGNGLRPINAVSSVGSGIHQVTGTEERYQSLPTFPDTRSRGEAETDSKKEVKKLSLQVTSV